MVYTIILFELKNVVNAPIVARMEISCNKYSFLFIQFALILSDSAFPILYTSQLPFSQKTPSFRIYPYKTEFICTYLDKGEKIIYGFCKYIK